jgi:LPPG:FO 2-phospho-L-lactate transferase
MGRCLAITGGVGGAKLALGLAHLLDANQLAFAVNTGDDFEHLGFAIAPDVDTLTYTLAGAVNTDTGWGRDDESWQFMAALERFGGETWFRLGDRDLALHVTRTRMLADGATLTEATGRIAHALGVQHLILPMSDDPVRTVVRTPDGDLSFQHYFVRDRCAPTVTGFEFQGAEHARVNPRIRQWLDECTTVVICPSNPFVSVDPILAVPGMREALADSGATIIAVSPIVGGVAIKGPTAKMMAELGVPAQAAEVAAHYGDLLDGFVLDELDAGLDGTLGIATTVTQTVMRTLDDRIALARHALAFAESLEDP